MMPVATKACSVNRIAAPFQSEPGSSKMLLKNVRKRLPFFEDTLRVLV
jgi:hypothetical protein